VTERLERWAARTPDRPFLVARSGKGWRKVSYAEALAAARAIGQGLLDRGLSAERPVLILSGNGIDHALLSLACLHVGKCLRKNSAAATLSHAGTMVWFRVIAI
jgi:feruloyl-CoA synthase